MTKEDEKNCLKELARGNKPAFDWLFLAWHPRLVNFFTRVLGDEELAYDYAQDVFFDIWKSREKFSEVESFSAYLFQMARFKVYNHFDKVAVNNRYIEEFLVRESSSTPPSGEAQVYASETEHQIRDAVSHMPAKRRKIFMMSRFLGYSNDQIASELGINKRTVENHITNALSLLRAIIKVTVVLCVRGLLDY